MEIYKGKNIMLMSCSFCNVKCEHCYITYTGNMEPNHLMELINSFKSRYSIMINGTEPILNPEYFDSFYANDQKYIFTNGLAISGNENLRKTLLEKGIKQISISYHFDIHDQVSKISKKMIEQTIKELVESGFSVRILTTISSHNYQKIGEYCDYAKSLGVDAIKFTNFINQGRAKNMNEDLTLSDDMIKTFFEELRIARGNYRKEELLIQRCGSFGPDISSERNENFRCIAGVDNVVLTPDGIVYPCIFLMEEQDAIGYYDKDNIYIDSSKVINNGNKCLARQKN